MESSRNRPTFTWKYRFGLRNSSFESKADTAAVTCLVPRGLWIQASTAKYMRTALFWVIAEWVVVTPCWRLGSISRSLNSWLLKIWPIGYPETSVRSYYYSLRNDSEQRTSQHTVYFRCCPRTLQRPSVMALVTERFNAAVFLVFGKYGRITGYFYRISYRFASLCRG